MYTVWTKVRPEWITNTWTIILHTASIPAVSQPRLISKGSTWVQIGWDSLDCDGGYQIDGYDVEYRVYRGYFYSYIYTIAARVTSLNYTIRGLSPNTLHYIRVSTASSMSSRTTPSTYISVTTHVSGNEWLYMQCVPLIINTHFRVWLHDHDYSVPCISICVCIQTAVDMSSYATVMLIYSDEYQYVYNNYSTEVSAVHSIIA